MSARGDARRFVVDWCVRCAADNPALPRYERTSIRRVENVVEDL